MEFFNSAVDVLQTLVIALGAGLGIWVHNLKKLHNKIQSGRIGTHLFKQKKAA